MYIQLCAGSIIPEFHFPVIHEPVELCQVTYILIKRKAYVASFAIRGKFTQTFFKVDVSLYIFCCNSHYILVIRS